MQKGMLIAPILIWIVFLAGCSSTPVGEEKYGVAYSDLHLDLNRWGRSKKCCTAKGKKASIASGGYHASKAGLAILKKGGNIIDASVAVAFTLAVERPSAAGIGGGGFLTAHLVSEKERNIFVDFRETAPRKATRDMFLDKKGNVVSRLSLDSALSAGTPGFVAGFYAIHKRWGKLPWKEVLKPAIQLAKEGIKINTSLADNIHIRKSQLLSQPHTKKLFFKDGEPLRIGDRLVQKDLAATLSLIAKKGKAGFYQGKVSKAIAGYVRKRGGILDEKDLKEYKVKFRYPLGGRFGKYTFISAPPPSAGGVFLAQMLRVLETFDLKDKVESFEDYLHLLTEVMGRAYADRSLFIGDPDFVKSPYASLMTSDYVVRVRDSLNLGKHIAGSKIIPGEFLPTVKPNTTHFNIIDEHGNAVSSTITSNYYFGSGLMVPGTGIFLNDEMDDFSVKPGTKNVWGLTGAEANAIEPLKRPVSSMSPTIVFDEGKPILSLGASGGSKIISSVMQVLLNCLVLYPRDLHVSVFAPRIHYQWIPDKLFIEANGFSSSVREKLKSKGHRLEEKSHLAHITGVYRYKYSGELTAVFDPRAPGGAEAY